jgi:hypothetical protein
MNSNNIRKVIMGKENAGTISPTPQILGSIDRRRSVAHTDDSVKEMIMRAPFIETVEKIGGNHGAVGFVYSHNVSGNFDGLGWSSYKDANNQGFLCFRATGSLCPALRFGSCRSAAFVFGC